jgi:hypothetical protein
MRSTIFEQSESTAEQLALIYADPFNIRHMEAPSRQVQMIALGRNVALIRAIKNPHEEAQEYACENWASALEYLPEPSDTCLRLAVEKFGPTVLYKVKRPIPFDVVAIAMKRNIRQTCEMFDRIPVELQREAFEEFPGNIHVLRQLSNFDTTLQTLFDKQNEDRRREFSRGHRLPRQGERKSLAGLNQDQLALMRWFETNDRESISVKELKQQRWGNTPFFSALVKQLGGRDISIDDLRANPSETTTIERVVKSARNYIVEWKMDGQDDQRIFLDRKNIACVFGLPVEAIKDGLDLSIPDCKALVNYHYASNHPKPPAAPKPPKAGLSLGGGDERYTVVALGWVRFTLFGRDCWIDEVQTDLPKIMEPEVNQKLKGLSEAMLLDFIRKMRARGTQRFFMPTYEMKKELYHARPPVSIYTDLPKKMRMSQQVITGVDPYVNSRTAWVLEGFEDHPISL